MNIHRREFLKRTAIAGTMAGVGVNQLFADSGIEEVQVYSSKNMKVNPPPGKNFYHPLEAVSVSLKEIPKAEKVVVKDASGREYQSMGFHTSLSFQAAGTLGYHTVAVYSKRGDLLEWTTFPVDTETSLKEDSGVFSDLYDVLFETLAATSYGKGRTVRYNDKHYTYYSSWFQDHVFVAEMVKYFGKELKSGIDLYADGQRDDGLIWDNYKHPYPDVQSFWEQRFDYGGFTYRPEDKRSTAIFVRVPVENIGEHTFLEGIYYTWKATGDTEWMKSKLDQALKAVEFATSSRYYWSEEKQLLKRPYTIDRWDFQSQFDVEITGSGEDYMAVDIDKTRFGIMFGDNICFANGCLWLAEMLETAERPGEAQKVRETGQGIWERINQLSWKEEGYYLHWYPLDDQYNFDFGVDTSKQITLSNAMALIRGLDHERSVKIIQNYQRIKDEMPESSPGEWYMCYPPFERGWTANKWEYMNGGVSSILAGDLALGAFENGFEEYGVDIMRRTRDLAYRSDHKLEGCYKGKIIPPPSNRNFKTLDIKEFANIDLKAYDTDKPTNWVGGKIADFRNLPTGTSDFQGITFEVINPSENDRKACMAVSESRDNEGIVRVPVNAKAKSLYLLHVADASGLAGILYIRYKDGSKASQLIQMNRQVGHFWYPAMEPARKGIPSTRIAWIGPSTKVKEVGNYVFGMNNPHPDKEIDHLEFSNPQSSNWVIFGITLSDAEHYLEPSIISTIPAHWAAAHVFKGFMEGLIGIKNSGLAFDKATLCPRWNRAGVKEVEATAKYESSGGYLTYRYSNKYDDTYNIEFTGSADQTTIEFLMPAGKSIQELKLNGEDMQYKEKKIRNSDYVVFESSYPGVNRIHIQTI